MMRSIRFRLYLVFAVLTALILVVAVFEAVGTRHIGQTIDRLADNGIDSVQSLARLSKLAAEIRVADGQAVLGGTADQQAQALDEARSDFGQFQSEVERYQKLAESAPGVEPSPMLAVRTQAFVAAQGEFEQLLAGTEGGALQWYRGHGQHVYEAMQQAIEALVAENDREADLDVAAARMKSKSVSAVADIMLAAALLLSFAAVVSVGMQVIEPLARLTVAMRRLAQGDWAVEVPATHRSDEVGEMARAVLAFRRQGMAGEQATEALREVNADLERLAMIDPLTGVANRRYFYQRAAVEIEAAHRRHTPLTCLMLDIDFFKGVNDRHGHAVGDLVLKRVADLVVAGIRVYDLLGRLGGEEFAVLLPDADPATAHQIAERLRAAVEGSPVVVDGNPVPVTISIGVSILAAEDAAIDPLLDRADRALYQAKNSGRNKVVGPGAVPVSVRASGR